MCPPSLPHTPLYPALQCTTSCMAPAHSAPWSRAWCGRASRRLCRRGDEPASCTRWGGANDSGDSQWLRRCMDGVHAHNASEDREAGTGELHAGRGWTAWVHIGCKGAVLTRALFCVNDVTSRSFLLLLSGGCLHPPPPRRNETARPPMPAATAAAAAGCCCCCCALPTAQVESRFRFLAADSSSTLSGQWPSYRQVLLSARHR
jgi:hypothetical protein